MSMYIGKVNKKSLFKNIDILIFRTIGQNYVTFWKTKMAAKQIFHF